jgi:uncharacterized protein YraI
VTIDDERPEASDRLSTEPEDPAGPQPGRPADQGDLWIGVNPAGREPAGDAVQLADHGSGAVVEEAQDPLLDADTAVPAEAVDQPPNAAVEPSVETDGVADARAIDSELSDALANVGLEDEEASDASMLRNPYVLAGLAVAGAIVLAVIVVAVFGKGGTGSAGGAVSTPSPTAAAPGAGILADSTAVTAVREGPGTEYPEISILQSGRKVNVVGRNQASTWFQILWPPESQGKGWVVATALRLPDGATSQIEIVSVTPIDRPTVAPPTATPAPTQPPPTATQPAAATPVPPIVDIALSIAGSCEAGNQMRVNISNIGSANLESRLVRIVASTPNTTLSDQTVAVTLAPGQSALYTGPAVQAPRTTVTASFVDEPQDRNPANNMVICIPTVPSPTAKPP